MTWQPQECSRKRSPQSRTSSPLEAMSPSQTLTYNVGDITLTIRVLAPPPGNQDAGDYLLTAIDALMNSSLAITGGQPTIAQIGSQELPAYDLTVRISSKRN